MAQELEYYLTGIKKNKKEMKHWHEEKEKLKTVIKKHIRIQVELNIRRKGYKTVRS